MQTMLFRTPDGRGRWTAEVQPRLQLYARLRVPLPVAVLLQNTLGKTKERNDRAMQSHTCEPSAKMRHSANEDHANALRITR